jgi:O-antigen/teichoic acid export membrane protein
VLAVATLLANVMGYLLVLLLGRSLTPAEFGAVGALFNLALVGAVAPLAVQLVAARETARVTGPDRMANGATQAVQDAVVRLAVAVGVALGCLALVTAPLLAAFLHLDGPLPAALLGAVLLPATLTAAGQGLLQGAERFGALAALGVLAASARLAAGALAAGLGWGVTGVMAATAVASGVVLLLALVLVPELRAGVLALVPRSAAPRGPAAGGAGSGGARRLRGEVAASMVSTAGLLVLFSVDVLLARHFLPAAASGTYAVGALFTKAAYWGPQFLATLLFPRMSRPERRGPVVARAVAATAGVGLLVAGGCAVLGESAVRLVAGERYLPLAPDVWLFAALGALLAVAHVLVYARLAVSDRRTGLAAWAAAAAVCAGVATVGHGGVAPMVGTACAGALLLVLYGAVLERRALVPVLGTGPAAGPSRLLRWRGGRARRRAHRNRTRTRARGRDRVAP